jgi:hypothetical protein
MLIVEYVTARQAEGARGYNFTVVPGLVQYSDSEQEDQDLDKLQDNIELVRRNATSRLDHLTGAITYRINSVKVTIVHDQGYQGIFFHDFGAYCTFVSEFHDSNSPQHES